VLRASLGVALDSTPVTDPVRVEFAHWHLLSVGALGTACVLVLVALVAALRHATGARVR
jgi:hypothetical protein